MIFKINDREQIAEHRPGDRCFKAREVREISPEEFRIRLEHCDNPLPYEWTPEDRDVA